MRIWTIHPRHLDRQALVAVWRESLLAQAVLLGNTKGYRYHPQLKRFLEQASPVAGIATYLTEIHREALHRGYNFDQSKIAPNRMRKQIQETHNQLQYEWKHLRSKVRVRSPEWFKNIKNIKTPDTHPLFRIIPGPVQEWERIQPE
ncbi:MAG: DNA lyase [Kiritimatiellae bacterium]|nr:DNA lyase [Kiritimatiellia bacterium]